MRDYREGFASLVLSREVYPEQDGPDFVIQAFAQLVRAYLLGVPGAAPRPEEQQRALRQIRSFDRAAGTGGVARAARSLKDVPQVVEPSVRVLGVQTGHLRRLQGRFVQEDEGVGQLVRHVSSRQGFPHGQAHHWAHLSVAD
jgi:hypothetical protein